MIALSDILEDSDAAKFEIGKERIELGKKRHEQDVLDPESYRVKCQEDRESRCLEAEAQRNFMRHMQTDSREQLKAVLSLVGKLLFSRNGSS